jgi:TolB protein
MRCVVGRALGAGVLALLFAVGAATAAAPEGPRLAVVRVTAAAHKFKLELVTVGQGGGHRLRLAGGGSRSRPWPFYFSPPSWSPDGESVAFSGIVGSHHGDNHELRLKLFTVRADGSGLRAIRGTRGASDPVFSPDGHTIAFTRSIDRDEPTTVGGKRRKYGFSGASIWTVDLLTGAQRQLTPWRDGFSYISSSFSPDGSTLLATHMDYGLLNESEPVALQLDGSGSRRLLEDGSSPVYSPDGSEIALIRPTVEYLDSEERSGSDLYVMNADGTNIRRLTRTPERYEDSPSWDPSGERLAYEQFRVFGEGIGDYAVVQVNADGSCRTKAVSAPRAFFLAPAWQPGPGREAGRIEC